MELIGVLVGVDLVDSLIAFVGCNEGTNTPTPQAGRSGLSSRGSGT